MPSRHRPAENISIDKEGSPSEPLFAAVLHERGGTIVPDTKERGLRLLQAIDWVLVDATYEQVDRRTPLARRNAIIIRDYPLLVDDLTHLTPDRSVPIVLIKKNVCRVLEPRLTADGFKVMNRDQVLPFPGHGHQGEFKQQFAAIIKS